MASVANSTPANIQLQHLEATRERPSITDAHTIQHTYEPNMARLAAGMVCSTVSLATLLAGALAKHAPAPVKATLAVVGIAGMIGGVVAMSMSSPAATQTRPLMAA
jgi:hypothetical protein